MEKLFIQELSDRSFKRNFYAAIHHLPLASLMRVLTHEPGRIEYYNQLFCLCGHLGGVSEIQTSLDISDLKMGHKRSRSIDLSFISHAQLPVSVARCII